MIDIKKMLYYSYLRLRDSNFFQLYEHLKLSYPQSYPNVTKLQLQKLLLHCDKNVSYYSNFISKVGIQNLEYVNPESYLKNFPVLTKDIIRANFEEIKSADLSQRKWYVNTSGGSTGEPIKLIQDSEFRTSANAITCLYSYLAGAELGDYEVRLWGSERDIFEGSDGWKANFFNFLTNTKYMNAFKMTPERMKAFISKLNQQPPKLITAYAQAIYELAKFAESEKIVVIPQKAIMTSAGTLYPWMRQKIEGVFQCKVYNRYGSREVSNIASEQPGLEGLWVAPWGHYIEIVDDENNPVPAGIEGNILITCLINYAMPLIRYKIGDRGSLSPNNDFGQVLQRVSGRNVDTFKTENGTLIDGEYFTHLLYFKDWVKKFQFLQKSYHNIYIKIVPNSSKYQTKELEEIVAKCKIVMGDRCDINIEFVDDIPASTSGKYRYTISEVN